VKIDLQRPTATTGRERPVRKRAIGAHIRSPDPPSPVLKDRMSDRRQDQPAESPIQRALRMKKAALDAKPKAPGDEKFKREQASGIAAGASKPWTKK